MKVLVTGSAGFIGTQLVEVLKALGVAVIEIDRKIGLEAMSLTEKSFDGVDYIVHLAASAGVRESFERPNEYLENNFKLTQHLFAIASKLDIPVIWSSSSTVKNWWMNPYATSKMMCEQIAPKKSIGLRFSTVYGATSRDGMFFNKLINGKLPYVTPHTRDFVHVDDIVSGIQQCILLDTEKYDGTTYDIGTGQLVHVADVGKKYYHHFQDNEPAEESGFDFEQKSNLADPTEFQALTGWKPKYKTMYDFLNEYIMETNQ